LCAVDRLKIVHEDGGFTVASVGPLLIGCWCRQGRLADLPPFVAEEERLIAKYPEGVRLLTILAGQNSLGSEDGLRQEAARLAKQYATAVASHATVLRASGLAAVFARSFLTGIQILSRTRYPTHVFADAGPGMRWILETPSPLPELLDSIDILTRRVERMIVVDPPSEAARAR
jgi:hypothetical protein